MTEAREGMRIRQRKDGGGEDREEKRNRNEESRELIEAERESQSPDLKRKRSEGCGPTCGAQT